MKYIIETKNAISVNLGIDKSKKGSVLNSYFIDFISRFVNDYRVRFLFKREFF